MGSGPYFICLLQLPTNPTPTELCMVTPKYNTVHVYKIRQPTTILQFKMLCIIQSPIDPTPTEYELSQYALCGQSM